MALPIGDALFSKTQQRVLGLLFGHAGSSFYLTDIVRRAGMGRGTVQRELQRLLAAGLVTETCQGNQRHYRANPDSPVFAELCTLLRKTSGVAETLRDALAPLAERIESAFIYGSLARGEDHASSDIDLMVISNTLSYADIMAALESTHEQLGRTINPTIYTPEELAQRRNGNAFVRRVLAQPVIRLYGNPPVQGANDDPGTAKPDRPQ